MASKICPISQSVQANGNCSVNTMAPIHLLYDLTKDRGEKDNLAAKHPKIVKELSQKVIAWHKSMPTDNGPQMVSAGKK